MTTPVREATNGSTRVSTPRPASFAGERARRPPWIAAGVLLVLGGALLFAIAGRPSTTPRSVLVAAADLTPGAVVGEGDVRIVEVSGDTTFSSVDAADRPALVGKRVRVPVPADAVLHAGMFTSGAVVADGEVVVGAALAPGEVPVATLRPGDVVEVLDIGDSGAGAVARAVVFDVRPLATQGGQFVSLRVPAADGAAVAEAAAGGRLRLLLAGGAG